MSWRGEKMSRSRGCGEWLILSKKCLEIEYLMD
jgi:hypothetical protein